MSDVLTENSQSAYRETLEQENRELRDKVKCLKETALQYWTDVLDCRNVIDDLVGVITDKDVEIEELRTRVKELAKEIINE